MSEPRRILNRGYELIWRDEDRLEDALVGLGPDFEWVVPGHPEGDVGSGATAQLRPGVIYEFDGELVKRTRFFLDQGRAREAFG